MNILIIPSWYPYKSSVSGQFFRNEASLISKSQSCEVVLIYPVVKFVKRRSLKSLFHFFSSKKLNIVTDNHNYGFREVIIEINLLSRHNLNGLAKKISNRLLKANIINFEKIDLIHAHSSILAGAISNFLSLRLKLPFIVTEHQHIPFLLNQSTELKTFISIIESSKTVLSVSEYQKQQLKSYGITNARFVIGNYIDEQQFQIDRVENSGGKFSILYVAYDGYIKGFNTFFEAIKLFTKYNIDIAITLITTKENKGIDDLKSFAKLNNIEVSVYHDVLNAHMSKFYNSADVFVSTSIAETFGVSHVEALFCGTPVISSKSGGVSDFLNEHNSILINIDDPQELVDSILKLYNHNIIFDRINLRNSVLDKYSSKPFLKRLLDIYEVSIC
jgi:glycosyltransferase involved in cell wall biosynthesis